MRCSEVRAASPTDASEFIPRVVWLGLFLYQLILFFILYSAGVFARRSIFANGG